MATKAEVAERREVVAECLADNPFATSGQIVAYCADLGYATSGRTARRDRDWVLEKIGDDLMEDASVFKRIVARLENAYAEAYEAKQFQAMALCIRELRALLKLDDVVVTGIDELTERVNLIDEHYKTLIGKEG